MIKRALCVFLIIQITMIFSGCTPDSMKSREQAKKVLHYLEEGDAEAIREMFCERLKNSNDLDEKIQEAIELWDGKAVSYKMIGGVGGYTHTKDGNKDIWDPGIHDIKTDTGKIYSLNIFIYKVNDFEPDLVGIYGFYLSLRDDKNEKNITKIVIEGDKGR